MRILFVGIHNKPTKRPLCSSTRSGKRIDKIASAFPDIDCVKMNLFNLTYMPKGNEWNIQRTKFFKRAELDHDDILVGLGHEVNRALQGDERVICKMVSIVHPSLLYQQVSETDYISHAINQIKKQLICLQECNTSRKSA